MDNTAPADLAAEVDRLRIENQELRVKIERARRSESHAERVSAVRVLDAKALAEACALIADLADDEECSFDHHGGCQEHGYLSLEPGEKCPNQAAKDFLEAEIGTEQ